jgi:hypothetical protein
MAGKPHPRWIICQGAERAVTDGRVRCPLKGRVTLAQCLGCHLLETLADERARRSGCVAGDGTNQLCIEAW